MTRHLPAVALLALAALPAAAQQRPADETKRGAYVVKHAAAKDLAAVLARHFKGAAEIQAGPDGTGNHLLVSAPPAVFDEVLKTIEQLDRRRPSVAVEIFLVELPAKKDDDKEKRPDEKDFSGPIEDVVSRLDALARKGQVAAVKRVQLRTLDGQLGSLSLEESKPFVMGTTVTARGIATKNITYRNVGTQIKVAPQVAADGSVTLELNLQDSSGRDSTTASVGTDEKGNPIPAPSFVQTSLVGKVGVASGKAVVAKDVKVTAKEGTPEVVVIVGARVVEPEAKK